MTNYNARALGSTVMCNERCWKEIGADSGELTYPEDLGRMKVWVAACANWLDTEIGSRNSR